MKQVSKIGEYPTGLVEIGTAGEQEKGEIVDIRGILSTMWRGKYMIFICTLIAVVLAFLAISQLEPKYRATAKVMFDLQKANVVDLQQVLVDQEFSNDTLQNQIEILRSTNLIERVVDELRLYELPEFNPALRVEKETPIDRIQNILSVPPEIKELMMNWGITSPPPPPLETVEAERRERLTVIENVQEGLTLRPVRGSRVIEISFTSSDRSNSARIVNVIADQYIVDQLEAKLQTTRSATDWLTERVAELQQRVEEAENAVEALRARLSLEAGQSLEITNQQLQALNGSLAVTRNGVSSLDAQYQRLVAATEEGVDLGAIPEFRDSKLIQSYRQTEGELVSQEINLKTTVPEGHPALVRLQRQIEEVRKNIDDEAARIISAVKIELDSLLAQEEALVKEVRDLETKALQQSKDEVELRQLEREAQASRTLYENFLSRQQETSAQEDLQEADSRVLSPAEPPVSAENQQRQVIVGASTILGFLSGIAIVFLLDRLNNTFRSPNQIEEMTGVNVLATVPAGGNRMHRHDVVQILREKPNGSMAESIRNLRTSILFSNLDKPPKVVMFTSSVPREGKSTTSTMMAMTSRQMGKSAIIVDCDLRMPALAKLLRVDDEQPGLLSVMEGTAMVRDALFKDEATGLHFLMTKPNERGAQVNNAADILSSKKFHELVKNLSQQYDLVILDTPPTLVVTDARIVSRIADAVVYAVRWDATPRGAVIEGLKELKSVDAPIAGIVVTMVNESRATKYTYEGYSYYKGQYSDYYEN